MAKHRRAGSRTNAKKTEASRTKPARRTRAAVRVSAYQPPTPKNRPTYPEAVALYERGLEALQRRDFRKANDVLRAILDRYPEERELHERARLYLRVCERETEPPPPPPQTGEERVYAATVALNAGEYDAALGHLRTVSEADPENDHAHYMLAVTHALRGDPGSAVTHLRRAIELNPENRVLARQESDFDAIRTNEAFRQTLEVPGSGSRRRSRQKSAR